MTTIYVYFSTDSGKSKYARLPDRVKGVLIRVLTWSKLDHVAVGIDGKVCTGTYGSYHILNEEYYLEHINVVAIATVQATREINLKQFKSWPSTPCITRFLRWLTRGRFYWNADCVCMVLTALAFSGVKLPMTICTPKGIYEHLRRDGRAVLAAP